MNATILTATLRGLAATKVRVRCTIEPGVTYATTIDGMREVSVREARVRVRAAIENSGYHYPVGRVAVHLDQEGPDAGWVPASLDGCGFDLPIALALLTASGQTHADLDHADMGAVGELGLDGSVRPVRGILPLCEALASLPCVLVASDNGPEAALADGASPRTVRTLGGARKHMDGLVLATPAALVPGHREAPPSTLDTADLRTLPASALRALTIAAAGGHSMLLMGGPGAGKTMLARRLPGVLPVMNETEARAVTRMASVAGLNIGGGLVRSRPFRAPHHSTTVQGLTGGGVGGVPRPGEASLASHGVLFLDELPEFHRQAMEALRDVMTTRAAVLVRATGTVTYPTTCQVVAAAGPCPCGRGDDRCRCPADARKRHLDRLDGMARMLDVRVYLPAVDPAAGPCPNVPSATIRATVERVRALQNTRPIEQGAIGARTDSATATLNAALNDGEIDDAARTWRVARTIADIDRSEAIDATTMDEAIRFTRAVSRVQP